MKKKPIAVEVGALIGFTIPAIRGDDGSIPARMPKGGPERRRARRPDKVSNVVARENRGALPGG